MSFENIKAEIALLLNGMETQPEDRFELYLKLREKFNELRAYGMPVPQDLVELEEGLEEQFREESATRAGEAGRS